MFSLALALSLALLASSLSILLESPIYDEEYIPLCTTGILDKRRTSLDPIQRDHLIVNQQHKGSGHCRMHLYTRADAVTCLDALRKDDGEEIKNTKIYSADQRR